MTRVSLQQTQVFLLEGFSDTNCAGVTGDGVVANMVEDSDCEGENGDGEGVIMIEEHKVSKSHRRMIIIRYFSMLSRKFKYVFDKGLPGTEVLPNHEIIG